jgi:hypothetical protein
MKKQLSTKTIATLTVVTAAAAAVPGISKALPRSNESQFDKLLQRHDRKCEMRAEILNIAPHELKRQLRHMNFEQVLSKAGMTKRTFRLALLASLRNELRMRGWTTTKIDSYIQIRSPRTLPVAVAM